MGAVEWGAELRRGGWKWGEVHGEIIEILLSAISGITREPLEAEPILHVREHNQWPE